MKHGNRIAGARRVRVVAESDAPGQAGLRVLEQSDGAAQRRIERPELHAQLLEQRLGHLAREVADEDARAALVGCV